MKTLNHYHYVIAIKERSAGNETVGDMWFETKSFDKETPVSDIIKWASDASGKLVLTIDERNAEDKLPHF